MNNKDCLEKLLLDIDIFDELKKFTDDVNIFDILSIADSELKHSIVLSYIFNPSENHGLGSKPLELFFKRLSLNNRINQINLFRLLDVDYDDFSILREYKNIDILMKSTKNKMVVCIENKIWTGEHDNQLNRYREIINTEFPDYKKIFVYLNPEGYEASDNQNWANFSYSEIVEILGELDLENVKDKIKLLISDYRDMIRRKIMNDYELKELCNKIYKKHKQAFDLIIENKDENTYYLYNIIKGYLIDKASNKIINFDESNSSKNYLRFTTPDLENHFPLLDDNVSSWSNKHTVFYEIILSKNQLKIQIAFGFKGVDKDLRYKEATEYLNRFENTNKEYKVNYGYLVKTLGGSITFDNIIMDEAHDKEFIYNGLNEMLAPIFKSGN